ncbi:DUF4394 domain-containing protein [Rufibacter glacialis]|uniref:DUF4394 domain-containing protein n=1 Tax=Rufibacter glacialis TaxID=1259555 RepID=A0A5M8Q7B9_9BACT|nr:DUF4394 domain-containing protein [Rufibacter glacialis]KAA6430720.1 DUF4394 domain-containing protein [Rufibacter glacialis]GGK86145.1 hypothetical protein GCM10011405_37420 [Rufibacter glacialis]
MKNNHQFLLWASGLLCLSTLFTSCSQDILESEDQLPSSHITQEAKAPANLTFYALTDNNQLVEYSTNKIGKETDVVSITGLKSGERLLAIDFRPATGQLYGVSNQSNLYVINQNTGRATQVGTAPFSPALEGTQVGFDFNPTVDRIRLVTNTTQNLRLNPETGAVVAIDGNLNPGSPEVVAVAYTNSMAGATSTALYDIDVATDKLYLQNPPNAGTLVEVGRLNVQAVGEGGFDISPDNSLAIAALFGRGGGTENQKEDSPGNKYRFYRIDLASGKATNLGKTDRTIIGVAIPTNPVAYGVDAANNLLIFNPYAAGTILTKAITGLQPGERVLGIDMRPATSQLYALGSTNRLYTVNLATGAFTAVGGPFTPALSGEFFGFDFNPTVDRIRVVSNTGQNLRLNPITGQVAAEDGPLNPGSPQIDASAYTNNFAGATSTALYNIDFGTDALYLQNPPNTGTQVLIGRLGVMTGPNNGFDIGGVSGNALALLQAGSQSGIYQINLSTGQASLLSSLSRTPLSFALGLGF